MPAGAIRMSPRAGGTSMLVDEPLPSAGLVPELRVFTELGTGYTIEQLKGAVADLELVVNRHKESEE